MRRRNTSRSDVSSHGKRTTIAVVARNIDGDLLQLIEGFVRSRRTDVVLVDSMEHAYSDIRRVAPALVMLWFDAEDSAACLALSMLQLDPATSNIPIVTRIRDTRSEAGQPLSDAAARWRVPNAPRIRAS